MAYFVELNDNNEIINIVSVANAALDPENEEASGITFLKQLFGEDKKWLQTSFNNKIRGRFAGIGGRYNPEADVFIALQPYPSWVLDNNYDWQPPTPMPTEGLQRWDEATLSWVEA